MKAILWSKYQCPYCDQAKALFEHYSIEFEERKIGDGWSKEDLLEAVPNARSVPQIFINEKLIGGFPDLQKYLKEAVNV